jgi:hypothetical protein
MRTPLRRSIAQVPKIARAGGGSLRQRIWSDTLCIVPNFHRLLRGRPAQPRRCYRAGAYGPGRLYAGLQPELPSGQRCGKRLITVC